MQTHLTLTGPYAGQTYCGFRRVPDGSRGVHMPYVSDAAMARFVADHVTCEDCRSEAFKVLKTQNPDQLDLPYNGDF